jgi:acyl-CoA thioesterase-1
LGLAGLPMDMFFSDMVVIDMQVNVSGKKTWYMLQWYLRHFLTGLMMIFMPLAPAGATPVIMVLGDSLVAGHGLPQGQAFPDILANKLAADDIDVTMINAGVSGDTTAGGLARLDWSLAENPSGAIIVLGGNDLLRGLDPKASHDNLDAIISRLKDRNVKILLAGMQAPRNLGADYAAEFDRIYPALAAKHDILLYPFFLDGVALMVDLNQPDGMHPNQAGVEVIAKKIMPMVKQLLDQLDG